MLPVSHSVFLRLTLVLLSAAGCLESNPQPSPSTGPDFGWTAERGDLENSVLPDSTDGDKSAADKSGADESGAEIPETAADTADVGDDLAADTADVGDDVAADAGNVGGDSAAETSDVPTDQGCLANCCWISEDCDDDDPCTCDHCEFGICYHSTDPALDPFCLPPPACCTDGSGC